jgi:sRNA-binding carbon storage regulator CsrA
MLNLSKIINKNLFVKINNRKYLTQTQFIGVLNNFTKYNLNHIEYVNIRINKPDNCNIFRPTIYETIISFKKDNMNISKTFENNDIQKLFDDMSEFIRNEVKL